MIEGSLEVKLPTIWTDEKQSRARVREKRKIRREKIRRERVRRKKMQMREKVGKSRFTVFFQ
jgi:cytidylate kinase